MAGRSMARAIAVRFLCAVILAASASAGEVAPFDAAPLVTLGDRMVYGSYNVIKIGEGVYQLNDRIPGRNSGKAGALGVDMYLVCGEDRALMIDLGNNYIDGYPPDELAPRKNSAEELRAVVHGLAGRRPLEIAITHMHPDHDGMTGAFLSQGVLNQGVTLWVSDGEEAGALQTQHRLDPSVYSRFACGRKSFDLGGGRVVETFLVRGHTLGGTVYILKKDGLLFTGDTLGSGFGVGVRAGERIRNMAEDTQKLVEHLSAGYSPYRRYALRVYTGHTWQNGYEGSYSESFTPVDVGYLDWRFLQDMATCVNGIAKGEWLKEGSRLRFVEKPSGAGGNPAWGTGKRGDMVFGIGSLMISLETAYDAAGLKMPQ
jgi:glyoxylase-like metal-dependent hydrolase (beta-lactamase superfamily II)